MNKFRSNLFMIIFPLVFEPSSIHILLLILYPGISPSYLGNHIECQVSKTDWLWTRQVDHPQYCVSGTISMIVFI